MTRSHSLFTITYLGHKRLVCLSGVKCRGDGAGFPSQRSWCHTHCPSSVPPHCPPLWFGWYLSTWMLISYLLLSAYIPVYIMQYNSCIHLFIFPHAYILSLLTLLFIHTTVLFHHYSSDLEFNDFNKHTHIDSFIRLLFFGHPHCFCIILILHVCLVRQQQP